MATLKTIEPSPDMTPEQERTRETLLGKIVKAPGRALGKLGRSIRQRPFSAAGTVLTASLIAGGAHHMGATEALLKNMPTTKSVADSIGGAAVGVNRFLGRGASAFMGNLGMSFIPEAFSKWIIKPSAGVFVKP